ncbi:MULTISPECIES: alpha-galactosidase [Halomonadaceae]|uniref:alpha-galactosidase n=1 Tax=Halomonadaceae TaxID=28256 RepID=UPI0015834C35|nr:MULTISPECIES: alpha-galactosidase [Halomonas]MDI4636963.1 alpha-galactosidase [Halomonas sp. BMC7]NUJ58130.1 alpha-galactosidase [Halomonas taeanensis]
MTTTASTSAPHSQHLQEARWLTLTAAGVQLQLDLDQDRPRIAHFGHTLAVDPATQRLMASAATPQASLDQLPTNTLFNDAGSGFAGQPALSGDRDGQDWLSDLRVVDIACHHDAQAAHAHLTLRDELSQLEVRLSLQLTAEGVLRQQSTLRNQDSRAYRLEWLAAACLPLPVRYEECLTFGGRWVQEFTETRHAIGEGMFALENRRGRGSHQRVPSVIVGTRGFSEQRGEVISAHLAWSGNHRVLVERQFDGSTQLQLGALLLPGEQTLAAGESITTPEVVLAWSDSGINGASQRQHAALRARLDWPQSHKPRPVHVNTWEALYFDHDAARLDELVVAAGDVGAERFVLDDGWFVGRDGERAALGDWYLDEDKYPNGLDPLIAAVHAQGMEFGLWVEPEMVNPDSELYRRHPDWILGLPGRDQPLGRYQCVLDLTRPEVGDYLFERLDALLAEYPIRYLKWDMNRDLTHAASQAGEHAGRPAAHAQVEALYALLARLRAAHPEVEIESCASGGARTDHGILRHTHRVWTSDCNDPHERVHIQRGAGRFLPPELLGAHIGPAHAHTTSRRTSLAFRASTALFGHLGLELDVSRLDHDERAVLRGWTERHKALRGLLHGGISWRLDCLDPHQQAHGVVSPAADEALFNVSQLAMPRHALPASQPLAGLDPTRRYRVELLELPEHPERRMKALPAWIDAQLNRGETLEASGEQLMMLGLALPVLDPDQALLLHLRACG